MTESTLVTQTLANHLVGRYLKDRSAQLAVALTADSSILTAIGNDYSFDFVFACQVKSLAQGGDVLIALSTNGRSANILRSIEVTQPQGGYIWRLRCAP